VVQALPSLQAVPLATGGFEQVPVEGSQTPAAWQASEAEQVTGDAPVQTPAWQVSAVVQALPSSQEVPVSDVQVPLVEAPAETEQAWQSVESDPPQAESQQTPSTQ